MGKKLLLMAVLMGTTIVAWAQTDDDKLSVTTQMFLQELNGDLTFERDTKAEKQLGLIPIDDSWLRKTRNGGRLYAAPDTIDGKAYIAAYLRLHDASAVSEVEALGVILQSKFNNGLYTSLIPVEKINDVAAVSNVKRINVSPLRKLMTKKARQATNVDDLLTVSADAVNEGISTKYDGTGVVLGIIDTGIDFNHIAFKDKNGNSRIKQAYVYNGSTATTYTGSSITSTLTDDNSEDHGTHTSTTAGGSSVTVSGTTVTVTDDHANATYGGMAPGADLYLAGINGLASTYLDNAVNAMCNYADQQGKPLVVSNSWGSQIGPHDGTGDEADVYNSLFGDSHPNRIALFAASNDGGKSKDGEGGGYHVSGTASSSSPLSTILRSATYTNTDAGYFYQGIIANAWARSTSVSKLAVKIIVLDSSTGAEKTSVTVTSQGSVSGLSSYYSGTLYVYYDQVESDKTQVLLYSSNGITSKSTSTTTQNGSTYYKSKYTLAIQVYPTSGSSIVDIWGGSYGYFTNHLTTSGYTWKAGSDDMCVSDEATMPSVISIGAYVTANTWKDYNGTSHDMSDEYTVGDIAGFSSYATAAESPDGKQYPWITAPGARLAAGVNHNHTASVDDYSYYDTYSEDLVVNSTTNPYAMMEGTSMATPTAAGIVALWLQASLDANAVHKNLTVNDVKTIMQETAINDSYTTTGANASHFGNGKIDALAGIKYILGTTNDPTIRVSPQTVTFSELSLGTFTETVTVTGLNLEGDITVTLSDANGIYSIDKTTITADEAADGATLTITYAPTDFGTTTATLTLSSTDANDVTVTISGTALDLGEATDAFLNIAKYATIDEAGWNTSLVDNLYKYTEKRDDAVAWLTLPMYGAMVGAKYATNNTTFNSGHPQTWIETSVSQSNQCGNTTWSATDVYLGSSSYFTSATAKAVGTNSSNSTTEKSMTFYVANTTAVKLYASQRSTSTTYPTTLNLYECTINSDGSLTASTTAAKNASHSDSGAGSLSIADLDASKVYKVVASQARGYLYEIAFQTPIEVAPEPEIETSLEGTIVSSVTEEPIPVGTTETTTLEVKGSNLKGDITATLSGDTDAFSITKQTAAARSLAPKKAAADQTLTITPAEAEAGTTVVIAFAPAEAKNYSATLTLTTEGADPQTVTLTGTGLQPELIALDEALTFADATVGESSQLSFNLLGADLAGDVTATLTDDAGVFSLSPTTVTAADAEEGAAITVTFTPTEAKTYTATVTLTTPSVEPVTVSITGTATPAYYDATITSVGLSTMYLDFPVTIPYDNEDLLGVFYISDTSDMAEFKLKRISSTIPPFTGVILQGNSGTYRFHKTQQYSELKYENKLSGSVVEITPDEALAAANASDDAVLMTLGRSSESYINFYRYSGKKLSPYKAFLIYQGNSNVRSLTIGWDDDTTTDIKHPTYAVDDDEEWYTLQGLRLARRPTRSGLYIHHGETVVVKY